MIQWSTEKPHGSIIVAKLTKDFCWKDDSYEILFYQQKLGYYYDYNGEEIPLSAIEKWALIEE